MSQRKPKMVGVYASPSDLLDIVYELHNTDDCFTDDRYDIFVQKDRSITIIYREQEGLVHSLVTQTVLDAEIDAKVEVYFADVKDDGSYRPEMKPAYILHYDKESGLVKKEKSLDFTQSN